MHLGRERCLVAACLPQQLTAARVPGADNFIPPLGLPAGVAGLQFQPHYRRVSTDGNQASFAAGLPPALLPVANGRGSANSGQYASGGVQQAFSGANLGARVSMSAKKPESQLRLFRLGRTPGASLTSSERFLGLFAQLGPLP